MPGFGRLVAHDPRDQQYPMRLALDPIRSAAFPHGLPDGRRGYRHAPLMDQGDSGTCVGHAWVEKIIGGPVMQPSPVGPFDLYRECVLADEFPDNDAEATAQDNSQLQSGTTVRAGAKVCQKHGLLKSYLWTQSVEDVRGWMLIGKGGVVLGVNWTSDMMDTDSSGFVHYTGQIEGGHCIATVEWDDRVPYRGGYVRAAKFQQHWRLPWGLNGTGFGYITEDDLAKLLQDDGECCAATEIKFDPKPKTLTQTAWDYLKPGTP